MHARGKIAVAGATGRVGRHVVDAPSWPTQLVAARTVAQALVNLANGSGPAPGSSAPPFPEIAGPREENLVDMAKLLVAERGDPVRIERASDPAFPESHLFETGALLPGPDATLAGPTFEEWLKSEPAILYASRAVPSRRVRSS
jgi:hypothetical protein